MTSYQELMGEVVYKAGDQFHEVMKQPHCEYDLGDYGFMGFLSVYDAVRRIVPKDRTIVDLGCYLGAQALLFDEYMEYIGVDVIDMQRFASPNTTHYAMTIQDFIEMHGERYKDAFAICSYVPDEEAQRMVRETFKDCLVYYPRSES